MSIIGYSCYQKNISHIEFDDIVTLGPQQTSSFYCSEEFKKHNLLSCKNIVTKNNFDEVHQYICNNEKSIAIIPNAWLSINDFYIHKDLEIVSSFICDTKPYYFAGKLKSVNNYKTPLRIATHPAPSKMIKDLLPNNVAYKIIYANSTEEAAQMVIDNNVDICLSNELAINSFKLNKLSDTFTIRMLWSVFKNRNYKPKRG